MINKKTISHYTLTALTLLLPFSIYAMRLSEIPCSSAGVLTTFIDENGIKQIILTREKGGRDKGRYDDFGGKAENYDTHPVCSATREFWEEAMLQKTVGLSLKRTRAYIDSSHTEYIIALLKKDGTYNVTYSVDFTEYADQLLNNFYDSVNYYQAKKSAKFRKFREKDRIAIVPWDTLMNSIAQAEDITFVTVDAHVVDPETGEQLLKTITLRPWFVKKLQLFAQNQPYKKGQEENVRFYSKEYKNITCNNKKVIESKQQ